jgi:hypothetical protein
MSLDLSYIDTLKKEESCFHDIKYTNDQYGGNQNEITFTVDNICGNDIEIEFESDGKEYLCIVKKVKVRIKGEIEQKEFLRSLQMILEAEKISELLGR